MRDCPEWSKHGSFCSLGGKRLDSAWSGGKGVDRFFSTLGDPQLIIPNQYLCEWVSVTGETPRPQNGGPHLEAGFRLGKLA